MRLCFIADARSTTARNWIGYFIAKGHEVHVVSTFASNAIPGSVLHALVPTEPRPTGIRNRWKPWINPTGATGSIVAYVSYSLEMPVKYLFHRDRVRSIVREVRPEILHSLRIPIEGELGAYAEHAPFVVSVWGNDFTLHARQFPFHNFKTREVIRKVNALFADSNIDLERAKQFGLDPTVPVLRVPGGGGVQTHNFFQGPPTIDVFTLFGIPQDSQIVMNARGVRRYVRNDIFLSVIPRILRKHPRTFFIGVGLKDWEPAVSVARNPSVAKNLILTGALPQAVLGDLYRVSTVSVSPSKHDGTPNTLLEAMACGCLPVCGDLPSIREWITPGLNGILFNADSAEDCFGALDTALSDTEIQLRARDLNKRIISQQAIYDCCMKTAEDFYRRLIVS